MPTQPSFVDEPTDAHEMSRPRVIDDWTAGDEPDFVVQPRRRRISGERGDTAGRQAEGGRPAQVHEGAGDAVDDRDRRGRTIVLEGDVADRRRIDSWLDDDLDLLARPTDRTSAGEGHEMPAPDLEAEVSLAPVPEEPRTVAAPPAGDDRLEASTPESPRSAERRTVAISGRPGVLADTPRLREIERRRPPRTPSERVGSRPDRIALWAVVFSFALILIAAASAKAHAALVVAPL